MSKSFIAAIVAGAIAITSFSAAPARAEMNDIEKLIIGAGTLFIIGAAIENERKAQKKRKKKKKKKGGHDSGKHKGHKRAALPGYCLRHVRGWDGDRRIFGARCLENNYRHLSSLPDRCRTYVEGPRGTRIGYRPRCLRKAGFKVARN